jgi:RES domain-containing protein
LTRATPSYDRILAALRDSLAGAATWTGIVYRSATPEHARGDAVIAGEGSRRFGGRWNPAGEFAAVYASLDPETAMAETLAHFRYYRIAEHTAMPRLFVAIDVRLIRMLDLRGDPLPKRLHLSLATLRDEDWRRTSSASGGSLTQNVGKAAFECGLEGLIVPSAAHADGANLVVFPAKLAGQSWLRVMGA